MNSETGLTEHMTGTSDHRKRLPYIRETSRNEELAPAKCSTCLNTHFLFVTAFRRHDMMCQESSLNLGEKEMVYF